MAILRIGMRGEDVKTIQRALNLKADGIFGPITEEAIKAFQAANHLVVDGIFGPATAAKLGFNTNPRLIKELIVHCTATPEGKDYTVDQIRQMHLARGFSDIGYHYLVARDGTILPGRHVDIIGAHCLGHNTCSIGISYIGGVASDGKTPKDTRTPEQKKALRTLLADLQRQYPAATVHGHYEFANKACPSFKICDL